MIRKITESNERKTLQPYATFSDASLGRKREEVPCDIRTCFQRDRDRIIHCKAFRRLKDKTQVFTFAEDHYRVRLTHTMEVMQIARTISRALGLNEDLTEAIALGHDLGHTPFGHAGERTLSRISGCGFSHNLQSVRVVEVLERDGDGLNLSLEVLDGIENHRTNTNPKTPEGQVVRLSDKIAYINHDLDDAIRHGELNEKNLPQDCMQILGDSSSKRIDTMIRNVIASSSDGIVRMCGKVEEKTGRLRAYLFEECYLSKDKLELEERANRLIEALFAYYANHTGNMPPDYESLSQRFGRARAVCDYISGMTDRYAVDTFEKIFVP